MDIDVIEHRLNNISEELKKCEEKLHTNVIYIFKDDITNESHDVLAGLIGREEVHYHLMNKMYKRWISQYSKEYIEMSEWYYGPELPYDIYCCEMKKERGEGTYLDTPGEIKELYFLFMFYGMLEHTFQELNLMNTK